MVFQIGSTLTTASGSSVTVAGGGAGNVYWQVGSSATLSSSTAFNGNILALASVTMATSANLVNGRAIALNGSVTMDTNQISMSALAPAAPGRFWNGSASNLWSGTNTQAPTSVFSGSGNMLITAPGTTVVLGANTFSGGTTIDTTGVVLAGNVNTNVSSPFGTGVLTLNHGYVDTYNSQLLQMNVGGYVQTGGEIGMHLEGTTPGSYTRYNVAGTAALSGGTVFVYDLSGNYVPYGGWLGNPGGDIQNIIHTTGGLSGQFASNAPYSRFYNAAFNQDFLYHQGDTLLYPTVTYDPANAYITWVQDAFDSLPDLTPNQHAEGRQGSTG